MDLHGYVHMHLEKNGKHYSFMTPLGSSYEECLDAAQELVIEINKLIEDMSVGNKIMPNTLESKEKSV